MSLRQCRRGRVRDLKEVNGKKLFLDHTSERGSHIIDEDEFLRTYGERGVLVASPRTAVAQPVREAEAAGIWEAAKELARGSGWPRIL